MKDKTKPFMVRFDFDSLIFPMILEALSLFSEGKIENPLLIALNTIFGKELIFIKDMSFVDRVDESGRGISFLGSTPFSFFEGDLELTVKDDDKKILMTVTRVSLRK